MLAARGLRHDAFLGEAETASAQRVRMDDGGNPFGRPCQLARSTRLDG
jgi:hypothetical protein